MKLFLLPGMMGKFSVFREDDHTKRGKTRLSFRTISGWHFEDEAVDPVPAFWAECEKPT
jgi:hypothetical protein